MTTKLTAETITRKQIRDLGIEAFEHGDMTMFDITTAAHDGYWETNNPHVMAARQACADAINNARAQENT